MLCEEGSPLLGPNEISPTTLEISTEAPQRAETECDPLCHSWVLTQSI